MLPDMTRLLCAVGFGLVGALALALGLARAASADARAPRGKVVRVERARGSRAVPRICSVQDDKAFCFGTEPAANESIVVLDQTGVIAEARVVAATSFAGTIPCKIRWPVTVTFVRGDLAHLQGQAIGVIDGELDARRARLFAEDALPASPPGGSSEKVVLAIDNDADGTPDLELSEYACTGAAAQVGRGKCLAEWTRRGGSLARVLELDLSACGF